MNTRQQFNMTRDLEGCVRRDLSEAQNFRTHFERYTAQVEIERQQLKRLLRDRTRRLRQILLTINGAMLTHTAQTRAVERRIKYYSNTKKKVKF